MVAAVVLALWRLQTARMALIRLVPPIGPG
jgi:hypothetical protein